MKHILLLPNLDKPKCAAILSEVVKVLSSHQASIYMDAGTLALVPQEGVLPYFGETEIDLLIVIGGDGSILDASEFCLERDIPLLGINLGTMGYLADVEREDIHLLHRLFEGEYLVRELSTLSVTHGKENGEKERSHRLAINEISIMHDSFQGVADLRFSDGNGGEIDYRCDGLLIATPAGSTAYALSAGGPVLDRSAEVISVTPVCPHSWFRQTLVYNNNQVFRIKNISKNGNIVYACADGRLIFSVCTDEWVEVQVAKSMLKVVTFHNFTTFETLRRKMDKMEAGMHHEE